MHDPFDPNYIGPLRIRDKRHLVIDITYSCNMSCINCNRLSNAKNKPKLSMTVEDIKKYIRDFEINGNPMDSIALTGGEPTVHPQFLEILDLLVEYCIKHNKFISLFTNGGSTYEKIKDKIPKKVEVVNSAKQNNYPLHFHFTVAPVDLGVYDVNNNPCSESLVCGRTLNKNGYFACPSAAAIDNFLGLNLAVTGMAEATKDELRRKAEDICKYCGTYLRERKIMNREPGNFTEQITSLFWKEKLKL